MAGPGDNAPTVIRISPIAHFASFFLLMALLTVGPAFGMTGLAVLLLIPLAISFAIERLRTVADEDSVTGRTLLNSRTAPWAQVDGLRFTRGGWARACLSDHTDMLLPGVTFATLPKLTGASGGRVPNPYQR